MGDSTANPAVTALLKLPESSKFPAPANVSLLSWTVNAQTPELTDILKTDGSGTIDKSKPPEPENGTNSALRVRLYYKASVQVSYQGPIRPSTATVSRVFVRAGRNLFDNFFFGTQVKTEFHPGAPMYVDGTVYVGGDLYTAHNDLHFLKDVSFTGSQTLNYKGTSSSDPLRDPRYGDTPTITSGGLGDNWDLNNPPHVGPEQKLFDTPSNTMDPRFLDDPTSNDSSSTNPDGTTADTNPNNDGYHELIEEKVTLPVGVKDPLQTDDSSSSDTFTASERLAANADYKIYVDKDNKITVYRGDDIAATPTPLTATDPAAAAIIDAITTNQALKDVREGDNVRLVTLDVDKIRVAAAANKFVDNKGGVIQKGGDGLLLYVKDTSANTSVDTVIKNSATGATTNVTSSRLRGVRLINGASLPSLINSSDGQRVGFTVVSPNTVYIQGDYNSGKTGSTQPASNTASSYTPPNDKPSPIVGTYDRVPSAVVADAVNILSNNWNDGNTSAKASRVASNTTINTCIVAGNVPTTADSYSGGIENFVRFHETWSGKYLTIYGALAQLYASQEAKNTWSKADYDPPNRRWYYDDKLQDSNPPGFHAARLYVRGPWTARL
jgi:hypothetical protein